MQNLGFRFFVIALIVGFLGFQAYQGVYSRPGLELGIDLQGGSELEGKFDFKKAGIEEHLWPEVLKQAISIIQRRIDSFGLKDINIQPVGSDRFTVQIAAKEKENVEAIKDLISVQGNLEFRITVETQDPGYDFYWRRFREDLEKNKPGARIVKPEDRSPEDRNAGRYPRGLKWYPLSERAKGIRGYGRTRLPEGGEPWVLCKLDDFDVTGQSLSTANYRRRPEKNDWIVVFDVKSSHRNNMQGLTEDKGFMAIILNDEVDSAPTLNTMLSDNGMIEGGFGEDNAKALAAVLKSGALKAKPEIIAERTIASNLAGAARNRGVLSIAIAFSAVLLMIFWFYRGPGMLANLALLLNLVLVIGVLYWFGAVLTMPGLAGLVLTVGMAVDANILVFERIKEEKAKGRTAAQAVATGYDRALVTIIDANITTLITAYMLFQIGSGPVRGFGITLAIGIIASMFTALYVTRTIFTVLLRKGVVTEAGMHGEFSPPSIRWMSYSRKAVTASAIAILVGFLLWEIVPEKKKYDVDFTSGAKLVVAFHTEVGLEEVRAKLDAIAAKNPKFKSISARVSAGGINEKIESTRGKGFELRTQEIGEREDIDALVAELRQQFKEWLLPGPFKSTIRASGADRGTGTIYFRNTDIETVWLEQALLGSGKFPGAKISKAEKPAPGTKSVFEVMFSRPAGSDEQRAAVAVDLRFALRDFNKKKAIEALVVITGDDSRTQSEQEKAGQDLKILGKIPEQDQRGLQFFEEADPFPLAERIDPSTAREHRDAAVQAIAFSILGIILYVAFRFRSWAFGFAAVVALIHDVLIVLGLVAACNWLGLVDARLNLVTVAAYLTLIGYSINDSIVVFDRIRENQGTSRARLGETIDKSLNQTLSRTLRTTGTTWVVVALLFGMNYGAGSSLEGFAFILTLGVLVGTYSSIFVASPTLLYLPWLWKRCGGTAKSFTIKSIPWMVGAAVVLLGVDIALGNLRAEDPSREIVNDLVLGIPAGILMMFFFYFVRFVHRDVKAAAKTATA